MTDEQRQMIADCEARESRLTDWERTFIDSIARQPRSLSERQSEMLDRIWEAATAKG